MWKPDYDPEGIFSTIPSIATCISGLLIGKLLALQNGRKEILLLISGLLFLGLGYLWNLSFPINKAIWSSSFVLVTSGWATIILSVIYYITDVKQLKFGKLFKYIGMNAITIYFLSSFISKTFYLTKIGETNNIHSYLYATFFTANISNLKLASLLYATTVICFYLFIGYVMFKKKMDCKSLKNYFHFTKKPISACAY
jgi:predicted acyltransferase